MLAQEGRDEVDNPEGNADAGVDGRQEDEEGFERLARDERGCHCEGSLRVYGRVRRGVIILSSEILEEGRSRLRDVKGKGVFVRERYC